jgi:hypothetical protein
MSLSASMNESSLLSRRSITGSSHEVLPDIYQDDTNIVIWQRQLASQLVAAAGDIVQTKPTLQVSLSVTPESAFASICSALGESAAAVVLSEDIAQLVDMFCCLFDLKRAGLRLTVLDHAMCPRFHVDKVPCRLVTTYQGIATEWLPHHCVNRSKLGAGNEGKSDEKSGLFQHLDDIHQLHQGEVALLKGENWDGNEGAGLVHRSPSLLMPEAPTSIKSKHQRRLLMTLDFN